MSCDRQRLSAYRDGELSVDEKRSVDAHLSVCVDCTAVLRGYTRVAQTIRSMPFLSAPPSVAAELRQRIAEREQTSRRRSPLAGLFGAMRPAAAAAAVMLTVLVVFRPGAADDPNSLRPAQTAAVSEADGGADGPSAVDGQAGVPEVAAVPPLEQSAPVQVAPPTTQPPSSIAQAPVFGPSSSGVPPVSVAARQPDTSQRLAGLPSAIGRLYRSNDRVRERLGQPAEGSKTVAVVEQSFQGGLILWRADTREMYVLDRKAATWATYQSTSRSGDGLALDVEPPPGALVPEGSFGLLWSTEPDVRQRLGWAVYEPRGSGGAIQSFERGLMIWSPHGLLYVLGQDGKWKTYADATPL